MKKSFPGKKMLISVVLFLHGFVLQAQLNAASLQQLLQSDSLKAPGYPLLVKDLYDRYPGIYWINGDANNFQVINKQGKVVNPSAINWQKLNSGSFPYVLRQLTGCDNSLGLIKLNFYSPFGVYLHDTPGKDLFGFSKRYFSHGCMRVKKLWNLRIIFLKENSIAIG